MQCLDRSREGPGKLDVMRRALAPYLPEVRALSKKLDRIQGVKEGQESYEEGVRWPRAKEQ